MSTIPAPKALLGCSSPTAQHMDSDTNSFEDPSKYSFPSRPRVLPSKLWLSPASSFCPTSLSHSRHREMVSLSCPSSRLEWPPVKKQRTEKRASSTWLPLGMGCSSSDLNETREAIVSLSCPSPRPCPPFKQGQLQLPQGAGNERLSVKPEEVAEGRVTSSASSTPRRPNGLSIVRLG